MLKLISTAEYLKGDRFSPEFVERRGAQYGLSYTRNPSMGLHSFAYQPESLLTTLIETSYLSSSNLIAGLLRIHRMGTLVMPSSDHSNSDLVLQNIRMHKHLANPPLSPESTASGPASIIDSLSDSLLNAFSKVRKPDERFLEIRDSLDKFEESLIAIERTEARARTRIGGTHLAPYRNAVLTSHVQIWRQTMKTLRRVYKGSAFWKAVSPSH